MAMAATLRSYLELVRFSHTVFALPFAIMAGLIAASVAASDHPGQPAWHWLRLAGTG